jgi:hypothetical protein
VYSSTKWYSVLVIEYSSTMVHMYVCTNMVRTQVHVYYQVLKYVHVY